MRRPKHATGQRPLPEIESGDDFQLVSLDGPNSTMADRIADARRLSKTPGPADRPVSATMRIGALRWAEFQQGRRAA